jgi:hypothetical protein
MYRPRLAAQSEALSRREAELQGQHAAAAALVEEKQRQLEAAAAAGVEVAAQTAALLVGTARMHAQPVEAPRGESGQRCFQCTRRAHPARRPRAPLPLPRRSAAR